MRSRTRLGFTLFQLLLVLAFLALLFALFLPAIAQARIAAARAQSENNLKQIALGAVNYKHTFGAYPPGNDANNFGAAAYILPYIEPDNLYQSIDFKKPVDAK